MQSYSKAFCHPIVVVSSMPEHSPALIIDTDIYSERDLKKYAEIVATRIYRDLREAEEMGITCKDGKLATVVSIERLYPEVLGGFIAKDLAWDGWLVGQLCRRSVRVDNFLGLDMAAYLQEVTFRNSVFSHERPLPDDAKEYLTELNVYRSTIAVFSSKREVTLEKATSSGLKLSLIHI